MEGIDNALRTALDAARTDLHRLAKVSLEIQDTGEMADLDDDALEQFVRAFELLVRETLDGGREQRELVMETAVPALVSAGSTSKGMLESHVGFFVLFASRLLEEVPADVREDARRWLAQYAAKYTREIVERAEGLES